MNDQYKCDCENIADMICYTTYPPMYSIACRSCHKATPLFKEAYKAEQHWKEITSKENDSLKERFSI